MNSTTGNGSIESASSCLRTTAYKIGLTITLSLIIAVSLTGNSFIVLIVYKTPTLRKPINYFIASMSMSDLLFSTIWIPYKLSKLHTNSWLIGGQFGQALCKLIPFFANFSSIVSIQNLVLITVDRFGAVVFPLRSPLLRSKLCPFFISATWIVAATVCSTTLFAKKLVEYSAGEMICVVRWEEAFGESSSFADYQLACSILFTYIPVILLVLLYSIILIKLKTQAHPGEQSANIQQQRKRRNRNVLQMSIAIVLAFMFCWLPYSTNIIIRYQASPIHFSCGFWLYYYVTYYMAVGYCAINPTICFFFSSNYREGLKRLINKLFQMALFSHKGSFRVHRKHTKGKPVVNEPKP